MARRLEVDLVANSAEFHSGMQSAQNDLSAFQQSVSGMETAVLSLAAAFGVTLTARGIKRLAEDGVAAVAKMHNLGVETGFTIGQLKALEMGSGGKSMADLRTALESIGGTAPMERLKAVADRLKDIHDPAAAAQLVFDEFGKSGEDLIPILNRTGEGITDLEDRAAALGFNIDRLSGEQVAQAKQAWDDFNTSTEVLGTSLAVALAPVVQDVTDYINDLIEDSGGIGSFMVPAVHSAVTAFASLADMLDIVAAAFHGMRGGATSALGSMAGGLADLADWADETLGLQGANAPEAMKADREIKFFLRAFDEEAQKGAKVEFTRMQERWLNPSHLPKWEDSFAAWERKVRERGERDLTQHERSAAIKKEFKAIEREKPETKKQHLDAGTAAMLRGTAEAFSAFRKSDRADALDKLNGVAVKQLGEQKGIRRAVDSIRDEKGRVWLIGK